MADEVGWVLEGWHFRKGKIYYCSNGCRTKRLSLARVYRNRTEADLKMFYLNDEAASHGAWFEVVPASRKGKP